MPTVYYQNRVEGVLTDLPSLPTAVTTRYDTEQEFLSELMERTSPGMYQYTFADPELDLGYSVAVDDITTIEVYGATDITYSNITEGNEYFSSNLWASSWDQATNDQKLWALREATSRLDRLAYYSCKTDSTQTKAFPRDGLTDTPEDVLSASMDIALKLLDDVNPEEEIDNSQVSSEAYAGVRTTFKNDTAGKPWITTGILSSNAWFKVLPYLLNANALNLIRA